MGKARPRAHGAWALPDSHRGYRSGVCDGARVAAQKPRRCVGTGSPTSSKSWWENAGQDRQHQVCSRGHCHVQSWLPVTRTQIPNPQSFSYATSFQSYDRNMGNLMPWILHRLTLHLHVQAQFLITSNDRMGDSSCHKRHLTVYLSNEHWYNTRWCPSSLVFCWLSN